jgi:hypothetical protein
MGGWWTLGSEIRRRKQSLGYSDQRYSLGQFKHSMRPLTVTARKRTDVFRAQARKFCSIKGRSNFEKNQPRPPEILILLSTQNIPNACLPGAQRSFLCRAPRI